MEELADRASLAVQVEVEHRRPQTISWHSFDLKSGRRGQRLITRQQGTVSRMLNEATESSVEVQIQRNGAPVVGWNEATLPARTMLVAIDDETEAPMWGGMAFRRVSKGSGDDSTWVTVSLITLEAFFDRRYVDYDVTLTGADQISGVAAELIDQTIRDGDGIDFTVDTPFSNWPRDRSYFVDDDKTILSALTELAGVENGIEFTVDLGWRTADKSVLDRIIRVRNRVGTAYKGTVGTPSANPTATFHMPGSVVDFEYIEDYGPENGANGVIATSSGEGDTRPESTLWAPAGVFGASAGWPLFEYRYTPSTSITDIATLDSHAIATLQEMWDGLTELTLEAHLDAAPRVGSDWFLGDDVAVSLTCPRFPERVTADGVRLPGYLGKVRAIGWEIDFDARRLKPRLLEVRPTEVEAR